MEHVTLAKLARDFEHAQKMIDRWTAKRDEIDAQMLEIYQQRLNGTEPASAPQPEQEPVQ